jgi:uncharacterized OB-fold protein
MTSMPIPRPSSVVLERCEACGGFSALARGFCARCGSRQVLPHTVSGLGVIWSITWVYPSPSSAEQSASPYAIALARLECGVKVMVRVPTQLSIGDAIDIERVGVDCMATFVKAH